MTLRQRATAGVFWVGLSAVANSLFAMLIKYVLVRMLLPAQFGLVAMAGLAIDLLQMFRELGFSSALIYRRGDARKAADTMFTVVMLIAVILFTIAFLSAPIVAAFFRAPELTAILRVLSINILIAAFGEVQFSLLAKNLAFRERLLPDLVPTVVYGVVAIGLALMNMGVWSLVIAKVVDSILTSLLAWIVVPWWRPKLRFDRQEARELLDYGKHIVGSSVLVYFITNLDNTFVGRVLGQEQLGFYGTAYTQANLPGRQISSVIGQVLFPAYSQIQDDIAYMRRAFFRTLRYVALVVAPLTAAMIVFAAPFINMVYGATWAPTILPLQVLSIYGLLRALAVNMGSVFRAAGKPHWLTYIAVLRLTVMGIFLYPATRYYGIVGVSVLSSIVSIVDFFISATLTNMVIHGKLTDYVRALWLSCVVSVLSAAVGLWSYQHMSGAHDFIALVVAGSVMMGIYALFVLIIDTEARHFIQGLLVDADQARKRLGSSSQ
jgi:O-antigen/teichoic acid export membrane protein